jgi:hypothetical protein
MTIGTFEMLHKYGVVFLVRGTVFSQIHLERFAALAHSLGRIAIHLRPGGGMIAIGGGLMWRQPWRRTLFGNAICHGVELTTFFRLAKTLF